MAYHHQQHPPRYAHLHPFSDSGYALPQPLDFIHMRHHSAPLATAAGNNFHHHYQPYDSAAASRDSFLLPPGTASSTSSFSSLQSSFSTSTAAGVNAAGGEAAGDKEQHIRVCVRIRPLNEIENSREDTQSIVVFEDRQTLQLPSNDGTVNKPMTFHIVEDETISQDQVFRECGVIELMHQALSGFATTAFAFGQTGSGKTFTMTGPENFSAQEPHLKGIIPRSLEYIFDYSSRHPEMRYTIRAAYSEIYNETVQDLLNPGAANLAVRYNQEKGFYVENLFVVECEVLDDCLAVLEEGLRNRRTASHALNEHSSRSHSIMTLYVDSETSDPEDGRPIKKNGKISFVDLAGSERVKETKTAGDMLTETHNINKSLLTLGNCISALADAKKRTGHIPYRDSKLTKLLSDSLGGNGMALMIACISPSSYNIAETMKTLRYANRAKRIKNKPVVQMDQREELIMQLKRQLRLAQTENASLRSVLGPERASYALSQAKPENNENPSSGPQRSAATTPKTELPSLHIGQTASAGRTTGPKPVSASGPPLQKECEQLRSLVQEYAKETDNLKCENNELLLAKQRTDHSYTVLMRENEQMQQQISRLETQMESATVSKTIPSPIPATTSTHPQGDGYLKSSPPKPVSSPTHKIVSQTPSLTVQAPSPKSSTLDKNGNDRKEKQGQLSSVHAVAAVKDKLRREVDRLDDEIRQLQNNKK